MLERREVLGHDLRDAIPDAGGFAAANDVSELGVVDMGENHAAVRPEFRFIKRR
jgi:hypothetical protein